MSKKPSPLKEKRAAIARREREIAEDTARLRRLDRRQRTIAQLARRVRRAVESADAWRIAAARSLVANSEYVVLDLAFTEAQDRKIGQLTEEVRTQVAEVERLIAVNIKQHVEIEELRAAMVPADPFAPRASQR